MTKLEKIRVITFGLIIFIFFICFIQEYKINNLEKLVQTKSSYQCDHGIAVITPDGHATMVCAP